MAETTQQFTMGIEEEYQIVGVETRELRPRSQRILPEAEQELGAEVQPELYLSQIETASAVCASLTEVRAALQRGRRTLITAAIRDGNRIAAGGTHPFSHWDDQVLTPKARYRGIARDYQQLARELVIFGCHVHVGLDEQEAAVQVLNRSRIWLAPLLALAANSPFWLGEDSGYASFRTELWSRFPQSGPPQVFARRAEYDALIQALVATGSIEDATKIYWDVRIPDRVPTVEFRVTDVCLTIDEAVMVAGLVRALVRTCYDLAARDEPFTAARPELLRAAHWRAARFGLDGELVDVVNQRSVPAAELVQSLLHFVRPALEQSGDWDEVQALVQMTLERGNGAQRQRAVYERSGDMLAVVDFIVAETAQGIEPVWG